VTQENDPYVWLGMPDALIDHTQDDLILASMKAAIAGFDQQKPEPLISLLLDDDPIIRGRGVHIFGHLGKPGFVALDAALRSVEDPDLMVRSDMMDGVLCYPKSLNPQQAHVILKLVVDPEVVVRAKVITFLAAAKIEVIGAAIQLLDEPKRSSHERAFLKFDAEPSQAQVMFDEAIKETSLESTFALASIERMARDKKLPEAPTYTGDDYVAGYIVRNVERLLRRKKNY
jgi:hypothetical protein